MSMSRCFQKIEAPKSGSNREAEFLRVRASLTGVRTVRNCATVRTPYVSHFRRQLSQAGATGELLHFGFCRPAWCLVGLD